MSVCRILALAMHFLQKSSFCYFNMVVKLKLKYLCGISLNVFMSNELQNNTKITKKYVIKTCTVKKAS